MAFLSNAQNVWTGTTTPTTTSGQVGIGITNPDAHLSLYRYSTAFDQNVLPIVKIMSHQAGGLFNGSNIFEIWRKYQTIGFPPSTQTKLAMAVHGSGDVTIANRLRIGETAANGNYANYKLSVDGDVIAKRCVIQITNWADFVFSENYELPSLSYVESFVKDNKHLPGVPSEAEIKEKGLEMGEINKILMQKVEELTLYMIDLQKEIDRLKTQK